MELYDHRDEESIRSATNKTAILADADPGGFEQDTVGSPVIPVAD